ncbi:hypothetical protein JW859_00355 [bacterium]|nr:hypothetical protein [bacterium]
MDEATLRWVVIAVLAFHGVGQLMGVIPALGLLGAGAEGGPAWRRNWHARSWLLGRVLSARVSRAICAVLWLAAFAGFTGAILGLAGWLAPIEGWRALATGAAAASLLALLLFWNSLILLVPHKVGNVVVNLAVVGYLALIE